MCGCDTLVGVGTSPGSFAIFSLPCVCSACVGCGPGDTNRLEEEVSLCVVHPVLCV